MARAGNRGGGTPPSDAPKRPRAPRKADASAAADREAAAQEREAAARQHDVAAHDLEAAAHDRGAAAGELEAAARDHEVAAHEHEAAADDRGGAPPHTHPAHPARAAAPPPSAVKRAGLVLDRTLVLFIGLAVGAVIGLAFAGEKLFTSQPAPAPQTVAMSSSALSAAPPACEAPTGAGDCAAPFSPRLLRTVAAGQPISVGVFGDSFGEGIWAALYWTLPKTQNYQVFKFAERSTGFTRYQSLNLEQKAREDLAGQPVDIAVISFGANDTQGILGDDGHVYALLTPGWKRAYGQRVARFVGILRAEGAMVYWVGLPKMRNPQFDSQIVAMNAFYADEMKSLDVPFFATEQLSVDDHGQFNIYLYDAKAKKDVVMRANDGIHMSIPGYERITTPLVDRIKAYVAQAKTLATAADPQPTSQQAAQSSGRGA